MIYGKRRLIRASQWHINNQRRWQMQIHMGNRVLACKQPTSKINSLRRNLLPWGFLGNKVNVCKSTRLSYFWLSQPQTVSCDLHPYRFHSHHISPPPICPSSLALPFVFIATSPADFPSLGVHLQAACKSKTSTMSLLICTRWQKAGFLILSSFIFSAYLRP